LEPDGPSALSGLAALAAARADHEQAASLWRCCLDRHADHAQEWWYASYTHSLTQLGLHSDASELYRTLRESMPTSPIGWVGQAKLDRLRGDWTAARQHWEACLERFPAAADASWHLAHAEALIETGGAEKARRIFTEMLVENPDEARAGEGLARSAMQLGHPSEALRLAEELMARFPERAGGYHWAEEALINLGRFAEAASINLRRPLTGSLLTISVSRPKQLPEDLALPPLRGPGNDYTFIVETLNSRIRDGLNYSLPVSVIIPAYRRPEILERTLAALTHQTYPASLIEVIVVDDGSPESLEAVVLSFRRYLNIRYLWQDDLGYRAAAARNLGARHASHPYLIFLDADMLPSPGLVEEHMRFFHVTDRAVLIGLRRHVCADAISPEMVLEDISTVLSLPDINPRNEVADWQTSEGVSYDWRLRVLARMNDLKNHPHPFHTFAAGNIAIPRAAFEFVGGFDEEFQHWGGEDVELGFRLHNAGYYFIPMRNAIALHQEPPGGENETDRSLGKQKTDPLLESKCPSMRRYPEAHSGEHQVPKVSIYIPAYNASRFIVQAVESALAQSFRDLEVVICNDGSTDDTLQVLDQRFRGEPRVRWVSQDNAGIAAASNTAVRNCRGMYIGQLDADDLLKPRAVEECVALMEKEKVGVVYGREERIDAEGNVMRQNSSHEYSREWMLVSMIATHFRLFRKCDWMRTEGFDESLRNAVDYDMFQKLSEVTSFAHLPVVTYQYRLHGENTSIKNRRLQEQNHLRVVRAALKRMGLADTWAVDRGAEGLARNLTFVRTNSRSAC